jgi:hypothetical protein
MRRPEMARAAARIGRAAWRIKLLLGWGLLRHGRSLPDRQLYLGRITDLSLYLYGSLCLLAMLGSRLAQGVDQREELRLLDYFLAEFEEIGRNRGHLRLSRRELLLAPIFADLNRSEDG